MTPEGSRAGRWRLPAAIGVLLLLPLDAGAQGGPAAAGTLPASAEQCLSCHGPFGRPDNPDYPIIGGQNAAYLAAALRAYRAGQRTSELAATMAGFAQELDDPTIDELAAFFAGLRSLR